MWGAVNQGGGMMGRLKNFTKSNSFVITATIVYSILLIGIGVIMAGGGDGSYLFLSIPSAPFSLLSYIYENALFMLFGIPIACIIAAFIATLQDLAKRRVWLRIFLISHYTGAALILFHPNLPSKLNMVFFLFPYYFLVYILAGTPYILGQVWLWKQYRETMDSLDTSKIEFAKKIIDMELGELKKKSYNELALLSKYETRKVIDDGITYSLTVYKDVIDDYRLQIVVQVYRKIFSSAGEMAADGFIIDNIGKIVELKKEELYEFT